MPAHHARLGGVSSRQTRGRGAARGVVPATLGTHGAGRGRPSKLYRRSALRIDVTLPARRYDLAARLLARATVEAGRRREGARVNRRRGGGRQIGHDARKHAGAKADEAHLLRSTLESLRASGVRAACEDNGDIVLGNCPFEALMSDARLLICTMESGAVSRLLAGLSTRPGEVRFTSPIPRGAASCSRPARAARQPPQRPQQTFAKQRQGEAPARRVSRGSRTLAPRVGIRTYSLRLTAGCSAVELPRN